MKILRRLLISLGLVTMIFVACKKDGNTSANTSITNEPAFDTTAINEFVCKCTFTYSYADTTIKDTSISKNIVGTFLEAVNVCDSIKDPVVGLFSGSSGRRCTVTALNAPVETNDPNTSEKKEFICECISTDSTGFLETYSNTETITGTKSEAIKICNSNSYTILTFTRVCKLKEK